MTSGNTRRREHIGLLYVLFFALIFRLVLAGFPRVVRWDEPDYLWLGKSLLTGQGYTIAGSAELHYTPLFPILSGAVYLLTGNPEFGSSFWYVLLGALLVLPVYALANHMYGRKVALISAGLIAVFPGLTSAVLYWGTMTEPLFIVLVYSAAWCAVLALERDAPWRYALVGALLGLAFLTRPEGIVWLGSLGVLFLILWLATRRLLRWRTLAHLGLYLAAFVLIATPYSVFLHQHTGRWMATGKLSITYDIGEAVLERDPVRYDEVTASLDSETGEILWWSGKRFERTILDHFREDPAAFMERVWLNVQRMMAALFASTIFARFLLVPVILGWFARPWTRHRLAQEAVLWFTILPVLSFLPFHVEVRFFSPALPALVIWLAAGLFVIGRWLVETITHWRYGRAWQAHLQDELMARWQPRMVAALLIVLLVYFGFTHVRVMREGMGDLSFAHKEAGLWLKQNSPEDAAIMSRDLAVSLYAERNHVASPRAEYEDYMAYARRKGATYLVVDEHELLVLRTHLAFLLDDDNPPPELEPVFDASDERGRTIVYRIKD